MCPLISKYLAPSGSLSKFDFAWFLLLTLSIWPHFLFVCFPLSLSSLASTSDLLRWEFHFASQPTAPRFNHGSCAWCQMENKARISCTQKWRGHTTGWLTPRVVLKWLGVLSSLQGISNLSNILFHRLQCRQIFEQNFKKYFFLNNFLPCVYLQYIMCHVGKLSGIIQSSILIFFHLVNWCNYHFSSVPQRYILITIEQT